jgi:hypothetical protein
VSPTVAKWFMLDARGTMGRFEMRNTLRPGEYALCNGLQGSSLKLERRELGWMAESWDLSEGVPLGLIYSTVRQYMRMR